MEYRRRRRPQRGGEGFGSGLRALALLLIFGAAAYLIFGTGLGKRIKEGYADSLLDSCIGSVKTPLPTVSSLITPKPTELPTAAPTGETSKVSLPAMEIYLLRMGVFDSLDTARMAAAALRGMGAADFVYTDDGSFSPIAAAYSDAASAQSVQRRLASEGHDCSILPLGFSGVELLITADASRLVPIRTAFALAPDIPAQIEELSIEFDSGSVPMESCLGVLAEIEANIISARNGISESAALNTALSCVDGCLRDMLGLVGRAKLDTASRADFSSALKTLRIETAMLIKDLLFSLGNAC